MTTRRDIQMHFRVNISIKISLKFVPKGPINNTPVMVQIKQLSEPMMISLLTNMCVIRPRWINDFQSRAVMLVWSCFIGCDNTNKISFWTI